MINFVLSVIVSVLIFQSNALAQQSFIDGYGISDVDIIQYDGMLAPSTSSVGDARTYFDSTTGTLKCSEDGGLYERCGSTAATISTGFTDDGTVVRLTTYTDNVGLGTSIPKEKLEVDGAIYADKYRTDLTYTPTGIEPIGTTYWDEVQGALSTVYKNGSVLQHGRELYFYGKASGAISNGDCTQFAGVQGDHVVLKKCVPSEIIADPFIFTGMSTNNIANGEYGYSTWFGKVNNVYTTGWSAGDALYWDNSTGGFTNIAPQAPNIRIQVGYVVKASTGASENGVVEIAPEYTDSLVNLNDVNGTPFTADGTFITWNNTNKYFDADSTIYSTGGNIGIGTWLPSSTLEIRGSTSCKISSISSNTTLDSTYCQVTVTSSGKTITLPTAIMVSGIIYIIDNASTGNITVETTSSQTIEGEATQIVPSNSAMVVMSNGSNWRIR